MNTFIKMLSGIKNYMYEALRSGISLPIAGATGGAIKRTFLDEQNASKSQRVMRSQRGNQAEHRGARRFDRNKVLKRFSFENKNGLHKNGIPVGA